jgi:hypothetical protein
VEKKFSTITSRIHRGFIASRTLLGAPFQKKDEYGERDE